MRELQRKLGYALWFRHFPLKEAHPEAEGAARAAFAAQQQGKFWPMHDLLFASQGALDWKSLVGHAKKLGLDPAKFEADAKGDAAKKRIDKDVAEGDQVGVDGTPTVFVNGRRCEALDGIEDCVKEAAKDAAR
jgi:protein-disulfide isomerase